MTYKNFIEAMMSYKKIDSGIRELYSIGFDLMEGKYDFLTPAYNLLKTTILSSYTQEGWDWIDWYITDNNWGKRGLTATKNGKAIANSLHSLYKLLEQDHDIIRH